MNPFENPDLHHLRAASGWLELGNPAEANAELENITPSLRSHPAVLELRWQIHAKEAKWDVCRDIAEAITKQLPEHVGGWIYLAYSTRRAAGGGLQAAYEILHPAAERFPKEPMIVYNLACYACQMGKNELARTFLERAFDVGDREELKRMALADKDLEVLWTEIGKM